MDLKQLKKMVAFAKKAGLKKIKTSEFEFELDDKAFDTKPIKTETAGIGTVPFPTMNHGTKEPTLEEINAYIYTEDDTAHN